MTNPQRIIIPILEALSATSAVMPWGIASLPSINAVIVWDNRSDSSFAIIDAVIGDDGESIESHSLAIGDDEHSIGVLIAMKPNRFTDLEDFAGVLRTRYAIATGPDPNTTERPF